jgi:hypothetical protein
MVLRLEMDRKNSGKMSKMRVFFIRDERLNPDTFYPLYYQPKRFIKIILLIFWVKLKTCSARRAA